jgi:hypothetical protein
MAIPDEVAQYAEGHRIVSYLPLGYVQDEDQKKPIWFWATVRGRQPYDFDSFRVFNWNLRRHRYETAFIARNVQGYLPVLLNNVDYAIGKGSPEKYPGFSVCLEKEDGQRVRRDFALLGNIVRYAIDVHGAEFMVDVQNSGSNRFAIDQIVTLAWAVSEVQFDWWPLAARGDVIFPMALWLLTPVIVRGLLRDEPVSYRSATLPLAPANRSLSMCSAPVNR